MKSLIAFGGKKRSGKTTICNHLVQHYGYHKISFADALKDGLQAMLCLPDNQPRNEVVIDDKTYVQLLQTFGTDVVRSWDPSWWVKCWRKRYEQCAPKHPKVCVDDVRFPNELKYLQDLGAYTVYVNRSNAPDDSRDNSHASEMSLSVTDKWDSVIDNNGGTVDELLELTTKLLHHP